MVSGVGQHESKCRGDADDGFGNISCDTNTVPQLGLCEREGGGLIVCGCLPCHWLTFYNALFINLVILVNRSRLVKLITSRPLRYTLTPRDHILISFDIISQRTNLTALRLPSLPAPEPATVPHIGDYRRLIMHISIPTARHGDTGTDTASIR